jgi:hypothetical protein
LAYSFQTLSGRRFPVSRSRYTVYHVIHERGGWAVEAEHAKRSSSRHATKAQAIERGHELARARKGLLKVYKMDGALEAEYDYRRDLSRGRPGIIGNSNKPNNGRSAWDVLENAIGTIDAPPDWSEEHDHYLYGTPKHGASVN